MKAFKIYGEFQRLGLTSENIDNYAKGYKFWEKNDFIPTPCRVVYLLAPYRMIALPLFHPLLASQVIGIEVGNICFFRKALTAVRSDETKDALTKLSVIMDSENALSDIDLRLPTTSELRQLYKHDDDVHKTVDILKKHRIDFDAFKLGIYWVAPRQSLITDTFAVIDYEQTIRNHHPRHNRVEGYVRPVAGFCKCIDLIGSFDEFGLLDIHAVKALSQLGIRCVVQALHIL